MEYIRDDDKTLEFTTVMEALEENRLEDITIFNHFQNELYQIISVADHTERDEKLVIYQSLNDHKIYAKPARMFFSRVDFMKYPDVEQEYKFEATNQKKKSI